MTHTTKTFRRFLAAAIGAALLAGCNQAASEENGAAAAAAPAWRSGMAIQLYSFHKDLGQDLDGTLARIKQLGFDKVETYPVEGLTPAELRAALDRAGLKAVSAHLPWDRIKTDLPGVVADAKTLGVEQFGPGSINLWDGKGFRNLSLADAEEAGEALKKACAAASEAGMRVFIHTHGNETAEVEGTTPLDRMSQVSNNCFDIEADVFWVKWAGGDPAAFIRRHGKRVTSLHLKDIGQSGLGKPQDQLPPEAFTVLGKGTIDWPAVMEASRAAGVRHDIIEDESPNPAGQIPSSLAYLDSVGG